MGYDADYYAQEYRNNAGVMMDRNLGATSATPGDVHSLGLLYQWGRKDPFLSGQSISSNTSVASTITWPSPVYSRNISSSITYATTHPTTYIGRHYNNGDWCYPGDNTRWQTSDKAKGLYDPCPVGYRVPDGGSNGVWVKAFGQSAEWNNSPNLGLVNKGWDFGMTDKKLGHGIIWYPAAGILDYYSSDSLRDGVGTGGSYWSCSLYDVYAIYLSFSLYGIDPWNWGADNAYDLSVRCQKIN